MSKQGQGLRCLPNAIVKNDLEVLGDGERHCCVTLAISFAQKKAKKRSGSVWLDEEDVVCVCQQSIDGSALETLEAVESGALAGLTSLSGSERSSSNI